MTRLLVSWSPAVLWAGFIVYLSSRSSFPDAVSFPLRDKVAHVILFGVLGATLAWGSREVRGRGTRLALVLLGILFAGSDEIHQAFTPGRHPSWWDFLADLIGLVICYLVARAFLMSRIRHKNG